MMDYSSSSDSCFKPLPRVAAVHDLCGYGHCSLGIAMPILSVAGLEVQPVPTAVLSAHTAFPKGTFQPVSAGDLAAFLDSWDEMGATPDGLYTGFMGAEEQIQVILSYKARHPEIPLICDPVLGDNGKAYRTISVAHCRKMRELVAQATVITPNLTEACLLLEEPYRGLDVSRSWAESVVSRLHELGAETVVLKGIERGDGLIINGFQTWQTSTEGLEDGYQEFSHSLKDNHLYGTGDLFASILTAGFFAGVPWPDTLSFAGEMIGRAISLTPKISQDTLCGVSFVPLIPEMAHFFAKK